MIPAERIQQSILFIRGQKVMLDRELAILYGVTTGALNQAVKRNRERFPDDFMFELTRAEIMSLSQFVISYSKIKHAPRAYAFTEQGIVMLSGVLNSPRAVQVNIAIMRVFVQLRQMLASHADLARKLAALEKKYDAQFKVVFDAMRKMLEPSPASPPSAAPCRQIGFRARGRARSACVRNKQ